MSVEILKPIALIVCLMSLCAVFQVAFLTADMFLWAGISVSSGMIFRADEECQAVDCMRTLPMQIFFWGAGTMVVMFFAAQYLETHCIFFRDVRRL